MIQGELICAVRYIVQLGDNCYCNQNFHLARYIDGYTVRNLVLRWRVSEAVNHDFRTYSQPVLSKRSRDNPKSLA